MRALVATNTELADLTRRRLAEPPAADRLLTTSTAGVDVDLTGAIDIGIIGVTLNRTVRNHAARLRECVRRGGTVRVAVIDPDGAVIQEAARRSGMPGAVEIFAHRLQPTLDLLAGLAAADGPGRVEVRLLDFVPAVGILAVDAGRAHGHLHVDIYSHSSGEREPVLTLHAARDQVWYQHFRDEFERIWASGRVLRREPA
ncbi:DUF5919 domain-containing protein [Actinoplanes philippinensis]|uniref:DUF5919 domain-containing protein n=1 Tax=Actinoplanes philippinensis TaxID=35752 RepID=UPI0033FA0CBA